jgi:hypothetical protein
MYQNAWSIAEIEVADTLTLGPFGGGRPALTWNILPQLWRNPLPPFVRYRNKYPQLYLWTSQCERLFLGVGGGFLQYSNNRSIFARFRHIREWWKSLNCSQNLESSLYVHDRLCFWVESSIVSGAAQTNLHHNFCRIVFSLLQRCP